MASHLDSKVCGLSLRDPKVWCLSSFRQPKVELDKRQRRKTKKQGKAHHTFHRASLPHTHRLSLSPSPAPDITMPSSPCIDFALSGAGEAALPSPLTLKDVQQVCGVSRVFFALLFRG
jgi:hypothetical protein